MGGQLVCPVVELQCEDERLIGPLTAYVAQILPVESITAEITPSTWCQSSGETVLHLHSHPVTVCQRMLDILPGPQNVDDQDTTNNRHSPGTIVN